MQVDPPQKIGLIISMVEQQVDGETAGWSHFREMAGIAEEVGFDSIWVTDHLLFRTSGVTAGAWECMSILAALAASTSRIEIGTLVACTAFRNPALLAKMADTVDEISGGRLVLGLGAGWHDPEFEAFGYPTDYRYCRFNEALQIITGILRTGTVNFKGRFHETRNCELRPRGPRPNGIPILIGPKGPKMIELTAQHADLVNLGFMLDGDSSIDVIRRGQARVDAACQNVGRDPDTLARTMTVIVNVSSESGNPYTDQQISGGLNEIAEALAERITEVSELHIWVYPNSPAGVEAMAPVLEIFRQA